MVASALKHCRDVPRLALVDALDRRQCDRPQVDITQANIHAVRIERTMVDRLARAGSQRRFRADRSAMQHHRSHMQYTKDWRTPCRRITRVSWLPS
jgi:hypothetical protein